MTPVLDAPAKAETRTPSTKQSSDLIQSARTLETFFEKFGLFVDAPGAMATMRELVLLLSVRGKLSEQSESESCGSQLAAAAAFARNRGRSTTSPASDAPFSIPANWSWVAVGDSMNLVNGTAFKPEDWTPEGTPIVRIQNLNNEHAHFNRYSGEIEPKFYIRSGDFLISWSGTPGTSFGAFIWNRGFAILNQHIFRCELVDGVFLKEYLRLAVNARLDEMISRAHGAVGLRHITKGKLESIPLPLPPLAEQKRIVAKVDELMALCDRLEAQQQERQTRHAALARASLSRFAEAPTSANINFLFHKSYTIPPADLRKSILTLAVQGKLVPQDPNDEDVDRLLARSLAQRRALKRTDATEVQLVAGEDALGYDIPESWRWQRLDDLLIFGPTNGFSPKAVDFETPVRSLTLSATTSGRFKGQHSKFITTEVPAQSDLWLRDEDILVQRGNTIEYVGVAAIYRGKPNCFIYPDLMMKLRVSSTFDVGYIHLAMSEEASRDFLRARASGTSGSMPKINQTTLKSLPLPIPPLAEQRRIVAKVDQLMALVDQLETQLAASRATAANLLEALVSELTAAPTQKKAQAEIIELRSSPEFIRAQLAAEIVHHQHDHDSFGQTKLQKMLYLLEYIFELPEIDSCPARFARGPHDPKLIDQVESKMKSCEWFESQSRLGGIGKRYIPLARAGEHRIHFEKLWPQKAAAMRRLIDEMKTWSTERCERFATLYASWNDLLLWNRPVSNEAILGEALENWHPDKLKIPKNKWIETLQWMRHEGYVPTGFGHSTAEQPQPLLF